MRFRSRIVVPCCLLLALAAGCADIPQLGGASGALSDDELALSPKELLGKRVFEDTTLSEPRGQACASCHEAAYGFAGNAGSRIDAVALGSRAEVFGGRNVPTAMYAQYSPPFAFVAEKGDDGKTVQTPTGGLFWDGRAKDLAEQAKGPFLNPREMNNGDAATVVAKVKTGAYAELFRGVYGDAAFDDPGAAYDRIADAIAEFERTPRFHPFSSKFDGYLRGTRKLSAEEARGLELFQDPKKGNCVSCHAGTKGSKEPEDWLFTDFTYDNLGLPRNASIPDDQDATFFDLGLCRQPGLSKKAPRGIDLDAWCGAFKVPTLRNVALTAPYGHNGAFSSLRDVVRFYVTRDTSPELWYPGGAAGRFDDLPPEYRQNVNTEEVPYDRKPGEAPRLADDEIDAVVAFLKTLTDE